MNLQTAIDIIFLLLKDNKNVNVIEALKVIDDVNHKLKKCRWHDLMKNPDDLPEEHESIFNRYYGTDKWNKSFFRKTSDYVLVTILYEDGRRIVKLSCTLDGKWKKDILGKVIAWREKPEPYEEV